MTFPGTLERVAAAGRLARTAHPRLAAASPAAVAEALAAMSRLLVERSDPVLEANRRDVEAAHGVLGDALIDRLRLDPVRLVRMAGQIETLAGLPDVEPLAGSRRLDGGLVVEERRRPVGVIGANYEARPNVTVDVASQLSSRATPGCCARAGPRSARRRRCSTRSSGRRWPGPASTPARSSSSARPTARPPARSCRCRASSRW